MRRGVFLTGCLASVWLTAGCQAAHDFLPRTHTVSTSPDGRYVAYVRQHLNPDPPDDHLYLGPTLRMARHLAALAPDSDWCNRIIWTADAQRVGFVISDHRVAIYTTATGALETTVVLVARDGYPGSQEAQHVSFTPDGTSLTFERVDRPRIWLRPRNRPAIEAPLTSISPEMPASRISRAAKVLGRETVRIPGVSTSARNSP